MNTNTSFLEAVAQDLINRFDTQLSDVAVVFPNKRASLFLNKYLARIAGKPIWSPAYITISDLFRNHSQLEVADHIELVCRLYSSYCKFVGKGVNYNTTSLDSFYSWGELLLADFDDIDKNLGNADKIFADLNNYQDLTTAPADMLTEEQLEQLRRLFGYFAETQSEIKQRFAELWGKLLDIYTDYRKELQKVGLAYEGMLYRQVVEQPTINFKYKHYVFVGFNMMQMAEQQLFLRLKNEGKALFYWDFDHYYVDSKNHIAKNEAGVYISKYLTDFPNALPVGNEDLYRNILQPKDITYLSAQTENIQAQYVSQWLAENGRSEAGERTAIVLADESLLPIVVNNLPNNLTINITTGYPLYLSPAASMLNLLLTLRTDLQTTNGTSYRLKTVNKLLTHPYSAYISTKTAELKEALTKQHIYYPTAHDLAIDEGLTLLFKQPTDGTDISEMMEWISLIFEYIGKHSSPNDDAFFQESLFRIYTLTNRIKLLISNGILQVNSQTLERLISQIINSTTVPFHGEPAEGIQVMGVLETRNLDFDHILFLSCNEGNIPKGVNDSSFIPYSIRKFHNLTTIDNKIAIYAYYFYRLLQRASDMTFTYSTATEGTHTSEMSRFMLQLLVETQHKISRKSIMAQQNPTKTTQTIVEKNEAIINKMLTPKEGNDIIFISPSAISTYLRCKLKYYYMYVLGLKEQEDDEDDDIDARTFGNIFHTAAELLYKEYQDRILEKTDFTAIAKRIDKCVEDAFIKVVYEQDPAKTRLRKLNGLQEITASVIKKYMHKLVELDRQSAPLTILGTEKWVSKVHYIKVGGKTIACKIGGIIDRLDRIESSNTIRIVDYKTGHFPKKWPKELADIFIDTELSNIPKGYYIQTLLYSTIIKAEKPDVTVSPALIYMQKMGTENYNPILQFGKQTIDDIGEYEEEYNNLLENFIAEIFDINEPFTATSEPKNCANCPFAQLCR